MGKKERTDKPCPDCGNFLISEEESIQDQVEGIKKRMSWAEKPLQELIEMQDNPEGKLERFKEIMLIHQTTSPEERKIIESEFPGNVLYYRKRYEEMIKNLKMELLAVVNSGQPASCYMCDKCGYTIC